ncbi:HTTM domain-containing protein [Rossellomorea marisflavi]|uniref:HTTM domain-containing protein n=1 Tax=Rossellomorea marisflavi TaxID=189381 RepID=UPI0020411A4A|nr:HTTM domain-containing protein [Rossellomorea marisflavi]MCM2588073.1 HTTM domain-containing protein [Rossellomorea marisflavi]
MDTIKTKINKFFHKYFYLARENQYNLISLSILRITIGIHVLFELITAHPIKEVLWNSTIFNYAVPFLYNPTYFNLFYYLGLLLMVLYTLGIGSNFFNLIIYVFVYTLYKANPNLLDGGNNILIIVLFYMIFTNNTEYFSLHKLTRKSPYRNIVHNLFFVMIIIQVCILYFFAGFFKAQGSMWFHGSALYYVLNLEAFDMEFTDGMKNFVLSSPALLTFGAYSAIFTQLFFPFLVFNKYVRYLILLGSIAFHLSILMFMGLAQFAIIMIALDLQFITDKEYKAVASIKKFLNKCKRTKNLEFQGVK